MGRPKDVSGAVSSQKETSARTARLESEVAQSDDGRVRLTAASWRETTKEDLLRAQERHERLQFHRSPSKLRTRKWMMAQEDGLQWTLLRRRKSAVRKKLWRRAARSRIDGDSMQEAMRDVGALGVYAVPLAEAFSSGRFQRRAGACCLSAGVAMGLRLGSDLGLKADQVKAQELEC